MLLPISKGYMLSSDQSLKTTCGACTIRFAYDKILTQHYLYT